MANIRLGTLNCNGLRDNRKRDRCFQYCKLNNIDIMFIQETHLSTNNERFDWDKQNGNKSFWSYGSNRARGVGIIFSKSFNYEIEWFHHDTEGRLIVLDISVNNTKYRLMNVYCPTLASVRRIFLSD